MSFLNRFKRNKNEDDFDIELDESIDDLSEPKKKKRFNLSKRAKIYIGVAAVVVIVLGGLIYFNSKGLFGNEKHEVIQTYTIPENEKVFINGVISPKQSQDFYGPQDGQTPDVKVSDGQKVSKGDVLFITKNEAVISEVDSLKSQLNELSRQRRSMQADDPALPQVKSQISSLNSQISKQSAKAYTSFKSNFDGKVYVNNSNEGGGPNNSPLITVQSTDYVMKGQVTEQDISKITIDTAADITLLSSGKKLVGRINTISDRPSSGSSPSEGAQVGAPQGQGQGLSFYDVEITFDSQDQLVNGFHAQASIEIDNQTIKVPATSILSDDNSTYVFKEVDGVLKKEVVDIVEEKGNFSLVRGNLKPNDQIVKSPTPEMKEGDLLNPDSEKEDKHSGSDDAKDMDVKDVDSSEDKGAK